MALPIRGNLQLTNICLRWHLLLRSHSHALSLRWIPFDPFPNSCLRYRWGRQCPSVCNEVKRPKGHTPEAYCGHNLTHQSWIHLVETWWVFDADYSTSSDHHFWVANLHRHCDLVLRAIDNAFALVVNRSKSLVLYAGAIISAVLLWMLPNKDPPARTLWNGPHINWPTRQTTKPKSTSTTTSAGGEDVSDRSAAKASDR